MAKVYSGAGKYLIKASFDIDGVVDKPDIIGAIFGQSEGLLGEQMDLKELQKSGKIGRIEVRHKTDNGKTRGELELSSSMDVAETSLLAAAIESVDKVGPCESKFDILKIEDIRADKRKAVTERAEALLKKFVTEQMPEASAMAEELRGSVKKGDLKFFGREKIPCGPDIEGEEIVVVEGRADVLNLLKSNVRNAIAMDGAKIPSTLVDLCRKKNVTVFIDGDRGGELNARKLMSLTKVDYVAKAPEGKEVEELASKEIHTALKKKLPAKEAFPSRDYRQASPERSPPRAPFDKPDFQGRFVPRYLEARKTGERRPSEGGGRFSSDRRFSGEKRFNEGEKRFGNGEKRFNDRDRRPPSRDRRFDDRERSPREEISFMGEEELKPYEKAVKTVKDKKKARILSESNRKIKDCNVRDLFECLEKAKEPHTIVFDGIITKRLADKAIEKGVKNLVGLKVDAKPKEVRELRIGLIK